MAGNTIAITGASGELGRRVVPKLQAALPDAKLRLLIRKPASVAHVQNVDVREADYDKPETLEAALAGVDTLLFISPNDLERRIEQGKNVVAAAKKAGVQRIVYTSLLKTDVSPLYLAEPHRQTEAAIQAAGVKWTFLRNGWYFENQAPAIDSAVATGTILGSAGEGKFAAATRDDFAAAAVAVLAQSGQHDGKIYELVGDVPYSYAELAAEISKQSGKPVTYNNVSKDDHIKALSAFLPPKVIDIFVQADEAAAQGYLVHDGHQLAQLIGRPTTTLAAYVAEALAQAAGKKQ